VRAHYDVPDPPMCDTAAPGAARNRKLGSPARHSKRPNTSNRAKPRKTAISFPIKPKGVGHSWSTQDALQSQKPGEDLKKYTAQPIKYKNLLSSPVLH